MKKNATPPPLPDPGPWVSHVEPLEGFPFARWRIYLTQGMLRSGAGETGWGWTAITLAGARRKAARELLRVQRRDRRLELRVAYLAGGPSIREMKLRLAQLDDRLQPGRGGVIFQADVMERAALRAKLGPLVAQPEAHR